MTLRLFVIPLERNGPFRGPKYFQWRHDPDPPALVTATYSITDYGLIDFCLIVADVQPADITALAALADVLTVPELLDTTLSGGAVTTVKAFLEGFNIPANWVTAGQTYRSLLRTVTGMFLFAQSFTAILGRGIDFVSVPLSTQYKNFPADIQAALQQAASDGGYDTTVLSGNNTLRSILKSMADHWTTTPIHLGLMDL